MRKKIRESVVTAAAGAAGIALPLGLILGLGWLSGSSALTNFFHERPWIVTMTVVLVVVGRVDNFGPLSSGQRWIAEAVALIAALVIYAGVLWLIYRNLPTSFDTLGFVAMYLAGSFGSALTSRRLALRIPPPPPFQ